ncbi:probable indole-3-pyruvate monooxygenase YUCCA10 [Typha latifolia]|uniref:probable indole-3-pyruvate monooxygenase YUCCA10 n=1 Tax=Typha latifolia TaxID=4733 RepID=UPI003C2F9EA4
MEQEEVVVVVVGAGPAGLAVAGCLKVLSIPTVILEREELSASLWKTKTYDRLKLHLAKQFCALPHAPHPPAASAYVSRDDFVRYLDDYVESFKLRPVFRTAVEAAAFDQREAGGAGSWRVVARDMGSGEVREFTARFLVVATGENGEAVVPEVAGLANFSGEAMHSSCYKCGSGFRGKRVLVVGSGNSGMEIAFDLANFGAKASIAVRSPFHVMTKEMIYLGMVLVKYLPVKLVDTLLVMLSKIKYGDLSKFGIVRPKQGPFSIKNATGKSAVIDVGTVAKIKAGEIQVFKEPSRITGKEVLFSDGRSDQFDAIIFATGYRSTTSDWLKDDDHMLNKDGFPRKSFPDHWKGANGIYFSGFARKGLAGVYMDAVNIANDIMLAWRSNKQLNY